MKRRAPDDAESMLVVDSNMSPSSMARPVAGSKRVSQATSNRSPTTNGYTPNFALPMSGEELGRLPVYGQFNFSDTSKLPAFGATQLDGFGPSEPKRRYTISDYTNGFTGSVSDNSAASLSPESVDQSTDFETFSLNQLFGGQPIANTFDFSVFTGADSNGTNGVPLTAAPSDNNIFMNSSPWSNNSAGFE
jgi:hypothetical protein